MSGIPAKKSQRRIFLWMPEVVIKPDKSRFELDATDPNKATLAYEETFEQMTDDILQRTKTMLDLFTKSAGDRLQVDVTSEGNTVRLKAAGPADLLTSMMFGEFMFQSFDKNPEKRFWGMVENLQVFVSTTRLPIRKLYEDYTGETLEELDESTAPVYAIDQARKFLADPTSREAPPQLLKQFNALTPLGKEHLFGYVLGYAKATNESLGRLGKALDIPTPGMTEVRCSNCGFQSSAPNSLLERDPPFICPKCQHQGHVKEAKF